MKYASAHEVTPESIWRFRLLTNIWGKLFGMKATKTDRRSTRSRRLLSEALISLLQEKSYEEITVQDLLDRADVGRTTFYTQYFDKDDLLSSEIAHMVDIMSHHLDAAPSTRAGISIPSLELFTHVAEFHRGYWALLHGRGIELAHRAIRTALAQRVERHIRLHLTRPIPDVAIAITTESAVGSFLALLHWWAEDEMRVSPEEMDHYFQQLVLPGVHQLLSEADKAAGGK